MDNHSIQIARFVLGFSWVYHGLFPKLLTVAPLEQAITATAGFSDEISYLITKAAGVGEILFGIAVIVFYRYKPILVVNIVALLGLCLYVAVKLPNLLIEAFNPVTTNGALIALAYVLIRSSTDCKPINEERNCGYRKVKK